MHHSVPGTVIMIVQAMIQDYPRRKRIVEYSASDINVIDECVKMNAIIEDVMRGYEPTLSAIIIADIINCKGYDRSEASSIASKNLYYNVKHKIIEEIAFKSHLV